MSDVISQERTGKVAAIYARVSSERQRQDETIQSQTVGLRELAAERGLLLPEDLVFEDEGFSGATLQRPALERLRDRAAEGAFEVLLCHAPDRLAAGGGGHNPPSRRAVYDQRTYGSVGAGAGNRPGYPRRQADIRYLAQGVDTGRLTGPGSGPRRGYRVPHA